MKVVLVVLVAALSGRLAEGVTVSACDLRDLLKEDGFTSDLQVSKFVCHANFTTSFQTETVTEFPINGKVWTLYGLFQLSNQLICKDSQSPLGLLCDISCEDLLDGDVSDDIHCLKKLISIIPEWPNIHQHQEAFRQMFRLIFNPECSSPTLTAQELDSLCVHQE